MFTDPKDEVTEKEPIPASPETEGFDPFLEEAREAAEGVELFDNPDAAIPEEVLREGAPGHETLTGESVGLGRDAGDDNHERPA